MDLPRRSFRIPVLLIEIPVAQVGQVHRSCRFPARCSIRPMDLPRRSFRFPRLLLEIPVAQVAPALPPIPRSGTF